MTILQVRDLPPQVHQELRVRAVRSGQSLSEYVAARLCEVVAVPTLDELYARIDQLESSPVDVGAADWLRRERDAG